jgi:transcriptional regulator with GAF, ATPase, and Fis domain
VIAADDLPLGALRGEPEPQPERPVRRSEIRALGERELQQRATLEQLLAEHAGNVAAVARALGKAAPQIYRWMRRWELDPAAYRPARGARRSASGNGLSDHIP